MDSTSSSDSDEAAPRRGSSDPLRPGDHIDSPPPAPRRAGVTQPKLGPVGYIRFFWRQLTSMRTALVLLLLLALAAVPGSLVPQRSADPNGVVQFRNDDPELFEILDTLQVFDTYTSVWFSAIYLLLFVSLIGCIIPRTKHHWQALRSRPPRTPARLERLVGYRSIEADVEPGLAVDAASEVLRSRRYRTERYDAPTGKRGRGAGEWMSVSAERGYLRETGNLVFHVSLVGVLAVIGGAGGFAWTGQKVVVQDTSFSNVRAGYDSFSGSRFFDDSQLAPFSIRLDDFVPEYDFDARSGQVQARDFEAQVSTRLPGGDWEPASIRVNQPLDVAGASVYLLGNGYAATLTVRDPDGEIVFDTPTPYLPQDLNLTSLGIVKVPDGLDEQIGMVSFFYPVPVELGSGAYASFLPDAGDDALVTIRVYTGDLGLDDGVSRNAYALDTDSLTEIAGPDSELASLELRLGEEVELPNGLGSVEFTEFRRFATLDVHYDPTQAGVLVFSLLVLAGLLTSLFVPRRRVWIKVTPDERGCRIEYAGLARGEDPGLDAAVGAILQRHVAAIEARAARNSGDSG